MVLVVGENRTFLSKTKQRRKAIIVLVPYALRCPTLLLLCYVSIRFFLPFQGGGGLFMQDGTPSPLHRAKNFLKESNIVCYACNANMQSRKNLDLLRLDVRPEEDVGDQALSISLTWSRPCPKGSRLSSGTRVT